MFLKVSSIFVAVLGANAGSTLQISREFTIRSGPRVSFIFIFNWHEHHLQRFILGSFQAICPTSLFVRTKIKSETKHWPLSGACLETKEIPWKVPKNHPFCIPERRTFPTGDRAAPKLPYEPNSPGKGWVYLIMPSRQGLRTSLSSQSPSQPPNSAPDL